MNAAADTLWSIRSEYAPFVADIMRAADFPPPPSMRQAQRALNATGDRRVRVENGVIAVLPFYGVTVQRAGELGVALGFVSVDAFARSFRAALADDSVSGIVIDIDSPGGALQGVAEFADEIYRARARKPVAAVANSVAAGGAYWVGSAAAEFYVTPGGEVGAIGVVAMHQDCSKALDKEGVQTTLMAAGRYKTELSQFAPLSLAARKHLQFRVDAHYGAFTRAIARNRGVELARVRNGFGQGRLLDAERARRELMVDGIARLDEVIDTLAQHIGPARPKLAALAPSYYPNSDAPRFRGLL